MVDGGQGNKMNKMKALHITIALFTLTCLAGGPAQHYRLPKSDTGLVLYMDFNSGAPRDRSGNGNDGTAYNGAAYTSDGTLGGSFEFDGSDDYVEVADDDSLSFGDASDDFSYTFSTWIYRRDTDYFPILSKRSSADSSKIEWLFAVSSGKLLIAQYDDTVSNRLLVNSSADKLPLNQWHHVTVSYLGNSAASGFELYINGENVTDSRFTDGSYTAMHDTNYPIEYGINRGGSTLYANGKIDEVRIYNYVLSSNQVSQIYQQTRPRQ